MTKRLFICEKPKQGAKVAQVLGLKQRCDGYINGGDTVVTWAIGHMYELAEPKIYDNNLSKYSNIETLPIFPNENEWKYLAKTAVKKQLSVIRKLLESADEVVIATDPDREGEVIGRDILNHCGYKKVIKRLWLNEGIDNDGIKKALSRIQDGAETLGLYYAGVARSRADWAVGMNLSRVYSVAYGEGKPLSIGRVQTPTLALVVNRDNVIDNFTSYPYYTAVGNFLLNHESNLQEIPFSASLIIPDQFKNAEGLCIDKKIIEQVNHDCKGQPVQILEVQIETKTKEAPLPYNQSELQKELGPKLKLPLKKILALSQFLYDEEYITYPRTPCQYLPTTTRPEIPKRFESLLVVDPSFADVLALADPTRESRVWNDAKVKKASHDAIVTTNLQKKTIDALGPNELTIYQHIRRRFVAQFYPKYEYSFLTVLLECNGHLFKASSISNIIEPGWKVLFDKNIDLEDDDGSESKIPALTKESIVTCSDVSISQLKTKPPSRFTEALLLDEMIHLKDFMKDVEDPKIKKILKSTEGLGTEATRADIIANLIEKEFIQKKSGKLYSTEKAKLLIQKVPRIISDPVTTAQWELAMTAIADGKIQLHDFLALQKNIIVELVNDAKTVAVSKGISLTGPVHEYKGDCPKCDGGKLIARQSKDGSKSFFGCSNWPKCKHSEWENQK